MTTAADLTRELERTRDETVGYFSLSEAELARSYGPGKWSVRFLLHHLADSESVFLYRIRRVISEPRQVIWVYDQDAWDRGLDYGHLRSEEHTSELQSRRDLVCRLLLEKKKNR